MWLTDLTASLVPCQPLPSVYDYIGCDCDCGNSDGDCDGGGDFRATNGRWTLASVNKIPTGKEDDDKDEAKMIDSYFNKFIFSFFSFFSFLTHLQNFLSEILSIFHFFIYIYLLYHLNFSKTSLAQYFPLVISRKVGGDGLKVWREKNEEEKFSSSFSSSSPFSKYSQ